MTKGEKISELIQQKYALFLEKEEWRCLAGSYLDLVQEIVTSVERKEAVPQWALDRLVETHHQIKKQNETKCG